MTEPSADPPGNSAHGLVTRVKAAFASSARLEIGTPDELSAVLESKKLGEFEAKSPHAACLTPLLAALAWRGDLRHIAEALPHASDILDGAGLQNALANLHVLSHRAEIASAEIDARLFPCIYEPANGGVFVLLERNPDGLRAFDGHLGSEVLIADDDRQGVAYFILPDEAGESPTSTSDNRQFDWFGSLLHRFKPVIGQLLLISLATNTFLLATTLFVMSVYDSVIPSHSAQTLGYLLLGMVLLVGCDGAKRLLRARAIAHVATRADVLIGRETLRHILALPATFIERAPIGGQISRMREFEGIREFFTGPLANVCLDLPFVLLFLGVIAAISGWIALIPLAMVALFLVAGVVLVPAMRHATGRASQARSERHTFIVEALTNARAIKQASAETIWMDRYHSLSGRLALTNFHSAQFTILFQTISHVLMVSAGIATLAFGVDRILHGTLSIGALVATMALIWRVLSPLQAGFLTLTRLDQILSSVDQINKLMALPTERKDAYQGRQRRRFVGQLAFKRVSFKYQANVPPALLGIDFEIKAGEFVTIAGANGSGKSSILKLACGLIQPQAGAIALDGLDIRQINAIDLRQTLSYLPQALDFFHGTIAQNLRLAQPTATDGELEQVAIDLGLLEDIRRLPEGFEARLGDQRIQGLPDGFRQRLALARAFLRRSPLYLLDEPSNSLDGLGDAALVGMLQKIRGSATIVMVTHRPSHMRLADRVLVLDRGVVVRDGPPSCTASLQTGGQNERPAQLAV